MAFFNDPRVGQTVRLDVLPDTTRMELAELLPCPFCGREPKLNETANHWIFGCDDFECVQPEAISRKSPDDAIARWNTRAALRQPIASEATYKVGRWLSAALDDPQVCDEMKADIVAWMKAGEPNVQPSDAGR